VDRARSVSSGRTRSPAASSGPGPQPRGHCHRRGPGVKADGTKRQAPAARSIRARSSRSRAGRAGPPPFLRRRAGPVR
jgi:hypothetical protein